MLTQLLFWADKYKFHFLTTLILFLFGTGKLKAQAPVYDLWTITTGPSPDTSYMKRYSDSVFSYNWMTGQYVFVQKVNPRRYTPWQLVDAIPAILADTLGLANNINSRLLSSNFTKAAMVALGMMAYTDTSAMLNNYQSAINGKQPLGTYATASNSMAFTNKSGNISQWTNDAGYLTSVPAQSFASLTGKPTTLAGYGITDAYPLSGNPSNFLTSASLSSYVQNTRSINTTSPLAGGGDLSSNRTLSIANSKADNSTLGAATFDSSYFNDNGSGLISFGLNYTTGTVSASAVTANAPRGKITYNSPNIIAAGTATFTLTNSYINSTSTINVGINGNGSNLISVNCYIKSQTSGSCVVAIQNLSLLNLFNTNMIIDFMVVN